MKPYILPLSDPQADLDTVGGKGMSLARLAGAGLPVPGGFHVTTEAYRRFVAANNLQPGIEQALRDVDAARPDTLEAASEAIRRLFARAEMPAGLAEAIAGAYAALPGVSPAVAVRSSATAEDLPGASFAGQQETYLNIAGAERVLRATRDCWASLWTARAIAYRARQVIPPEGVALAVVVQLLVAAEAAGVMFTANPVDGSRDQVVINAAWGLGEAIVGGVVTPDTLTIHKREGRVVRRETAAKQVMAVRTETGTAEQAVPADLQNTPVLSDDRAVELARLGVQIEALYGMPMDVEWALAGGQLAILQARPITALPEPPIAWTPPDPKGIYMRGGVVDLMPGPLSPLFATWGIPAQVQQMRPLGKRLTGREADMASDYYTTINNYAYGNAAIPGKAWPWILTAMLPFMLQPWSKLAAVWREELHPGYQAAVARLQNGDPAQMPAGELWRVAQELEDAAAYYVCGLTLATMGSAAGAEGLLTRVYDRLAKRPGDPDASALLMGWDNIAVRAEKSLYDIARWVQRDADLTRYLLETPAPELAAQLSSSAGAPAGEAPALEAWETFAVRFEAHQEVFGHIAFQLDFVEPLPLDQPELSLETIRMYLRGEGSNPHERQKAAEQRRLQTAETMLKRLKGPGRWVFRKVLHWAQALAEVREDALAETGLAYPRLRALLRELGQRFVAAGAIREAGDIYWLEKDEVAACVARLAGNQALDDLALKVTERKAFHERAGRATPPPMIPIRKRIMGIKTDIFITHTQEVQGGNVLKGVATGAGKVTAPARVLRGPEDFGQMRPGDVLVARTTTPAWTPLFAMASAVVTDMGGPLSHGSIVAREYGIPAVMGTGVATQRITSGQKVTVDGSAGTVTLL